jgi:succinate dehydrogenase / fumarate reductase membrane anchor subunit
VIGEKIVREAAARQGRQGSLFELYAWFFMRVSGVILLVMVLFHMIYLQFIIPGGVAAIDHALVVSRWTDPVWGIFWRTFDLLLLAFSLTHGSNGIRYLIDDYIEQDERRVLAKLMLYLGFAVLMVMGVVVIVSFKSH